MLVIKYKIKSLFKYIFILPVLSFCLMGSSCTKEKIITKTLVLKDTVFITQYDTVFLKQYLSDSATTFILVRHAEKEVGGSNPDLSPAGILRAQQLKHLLSRIPLTGIYSTHYNRTEQTAQPVAGDHQLPIEYYNPTDLNQLITRVKSRHFNKKVLVVGHSNTTPKLANLLLNQHIFSSIPDSEYDNIYLIRVYRSSPAEVLHLKFGNP